MIEHPAGTKGIIAVKESIKRKWRGVSGTITSLLLDSLSYTDSNSGEHMQVSGVQLVDTEIGPTFVRPGDFIPFDPEHGEAMQTLVEYLGDKQ